MFVTEEGIPLEAGLAQFEGTDVQTPGFSHRLSLDPAKGIQTFFAIVVDRYQNRRAIPAETFLKFVEETGTILSDAQVEYLDLVPKKRKGFLGM